MRIFATLILTLLAAQAAQADMYRWVDQNGAVHYTQTPPPAGATASTVKAAPPPAPRRAAPQGSLRQYGAELEKDRKAREKASQEAAASSEKRQLNCGNARTHLHQQTDYQGRLYRIDADGNRVSQSAEENAQARTALQQQVDENCE